MNAKQFCELVADTTWVFDFFGVGFDYLLQFPPQEFESPDDEVILSLQKADKEKLADAITAAHGEIRQLCIRIWVFRIDTGFLNVVRKPPSPHRPSGPC